MEYESKKDQAFNFMDLAKKKLKQNNFDKAIKFYKESQQIFDEINWSEGSKMTKESINAIHLKKQRLEREEKLLAQKKQEKIKNEAQLELQITNDLQQVHPRRELLAIQEEKKREREISDKAYKLLEAGAKLKDDKRFEEAYEKYIMGRDMFKKIGWEHDVSRINNDLMITLKKEMKQTEKLKAYQQTKVEEKKELEELLKEAEGKQEILKKIRNEEKRKQREKLIKKEIQESTIYASKETVFEEIIERAMNLINEAESVVKSYEMGLKSDILIYKNPYEQAILNYETAQQLFQKVGWKEEAHKLKGSIKFYRDKKVKDDNLRALEHQKLDILKKKQNNELEVKIGNKERILNLLKSNAFTSKEIARELNLSEKNTRTYLLRLKKEEKIKSINKKGRFLIYILQKPMVSIDQSNEIGGLKDDLSYLLNLLELKMTPKNGAKFTSTDIINIRRIEERIANAPGISSKTRDMIKDLIDFEQSFKEEVNEKITKLEKRVDIITSRKFNFIKDKKVEAEKELANLIIDDHLKPVSVKKLLKNKTIKKRNQRVEEYDYLFKSIVIGDGGVGKTALTLRFSKGFFTEDYKMTIGVDFHVKTIAIETFEGPIKCKIQLWDTGGQERFSSIRPMYYRGTLGTILVFDLTNVASFPVLLVGNKSDLTAQRAVSIQEINNFTRDFNLYYMETSAKTGDGVGDCFYILACLMIGQGVPDQLIANTTVYAPGQIIVGSEYTAPPVPEPALVSQFIGNQEIDILEPTDIEFKMPVQIIAAKSQPSEQEFMPNENN